MVFMTEEVTQGSSIHVGKGWNIPPCVPLLVVLICINTIKYLLIGVQSAVVYDFYSTIIDLVSISAVQNKNTTTVVFPE